MDVALLKAIAFSSTALALFFSIVLHEIAHGFAAFLLGDDTAKNAGRLTLNPLAHVDRTGTVFLPLLLLLARTPFLFGWAKPVPVRFDSLKYGGLGMALVALAGPASNFVLAALSLTVLEMFFRFSDSWTALFFQNMVFCNLSLMLFNLIPVLPLDGGRIVHGLLPEKAAAAFARTERWGFGLMILFLIVLPALGDFFGYNWNVVGMYLLAGGRVFLTAAAKVAGFFS